MGYTIFRFPLFMYYMLTANSPFEGVCTWRTHGMHFSVTYSRTNRFSWIPFFKRLDLSGLFTMDIIIRHMLLYWNILLGLHSRCFCLILLLFDTAILNSFSVYCRLYLLSLQNTQGQSAIEKQQKGIQSKLTHNNKRLKSLQHSCKYLMLSDINFKI